MKQKAAIFITPAVFLILIFGMTVLNFSMPDKSFSESENRFLQQKPQFSWSALFDGTFTADVEKYITDQFPWRDGFIGVKTETEYVTGKRDTSGVYFGSDGYLIEKHDPASVDQKKLEKNQQRLENFISRVAGELGEDHVRVMIAPTAGEILKEKLPPYAQEFSQAEMFARMKEKIPAGCWVDLLAVMQQHSGENLYYKTDHHWTTDGAYLAYRAWCASVGVPGMTADEFDREAVTDRFFGTIYRKARLSSTKPDTIYAYFPKQEYRYHLTYDLGAKESDSLYEESYLEKKDKYSYLLGGNNGVVTIQGPNQNGKTLLLVKDSYAHSMAPFLANEFETIQMVDLRYYNGSLKEFQQQQGITDVLVLYNAVTFSEDLGVLKMDK